MGKWKKRYSPARGGMITIGDADYPYMDIVKIAELADAHNADCDAYEARIVELNATLDQIREVLQTAFNFQEVAQRVLDILYPQETHNG